MGGVPESSPEPPPSSPAEGQLPPSGVKQVEALVSQQPPLQSESVVQVAAVPIVSVPPPLPLAEPPPLLELGAGAPPPLLELGVEASLVTLEFVAFSKGLEFVLDDPHATSVRAPM
jgi:hypothetical protein